jgi:hypothetical protein
MADKLPTHTDHTGVVRTLGTLPPPPGLSVPAKRAPIVLPESAWEEFDLEDADPNPVKDQGQYGACTGHGTAQAMELARWVGGQPVAELSAWYVYAILCGGIDRGASIGEALNLVTARGTCLDASVPHGTINPRKLSAADTAEAARFKVEIGASLTSFAELMTAAQLRRPGCFSLHVGANFDNLTAEGGVGYSRGAGNHAIAFGYGAKRLKSGDWALKFKNSWTRQWSLNGYAWFTARHVDGQPYFEAYDLLAIAEDPADASNPPAA